MSLHCPIARQALRIIMLLLASLFACRGQPKSEVRPPKLIDPVEGRKEGCALAAELLAQQPERDSTNSGVLEIHESTGQRRLVPMRFKVVTGQTNWLSIYEAMTNASTESAGVRLTVVHTQGQPNEYWLSAIVPAEAIFQGRHSVSGNRTMIPFAGSDFWIEDLGLEFLHWPEQRLLKKEMRRGQSCEVLESINPNTAAGAYSRVVSWLEIESPHGIVHVDAYDSRNQLLKEFDPKKLEKHDGQWQPEKLEIRNRQTGSRTYIEYDLSHLDN